MRFLLRLILTKLLIVLLAPSVFAAGALVQCDTQQNGSASSDTVTLTGTTAGNLLFSIMTFDNDGLASFSDNDSNTWTCIDGCSSDLREDRVYVAYGYAENIDGGDVTITGTADSSGEIQITVCEFSGVETSSSYVGTSAAGGNATSVSSGNVTASDDLCIGAMGYDDDNVFSGVTSGFTEATHQDGDTSNIHGTAIEYKADCNGSTNSQMTLTASGRLVSTITAFHQSSGSPPASRRIW